MVENEHAENGSQRTEQSSKHQKSSLTYAEFLSRTEGKHVLFLEIGVGANTPVIIKYPFWQMVNDNPRAVYACLNYDEAICPKQIENRSICIDGDTGEVLKLIKGGN